MARAAQSAEARLIGPVQRAQVVGENGEAAHGAERVPVAIRIDLPAVIPLHLVRHVRDGVAAPAPVLVGDVLVAPGERDRLEADPAHLVGVGEHEIEQRTHLGLVHAVHQRGHGHDVDTGIVQHVDRLELDVEEVADVPVLVGVVRYAVELEVREIEARLLGGVRELRLEGEAQPVGRRLDCVVPDLLGVPARLEEMGRHRRLAP